MHCVNRCLLAETSVCLPGDFSPGLRQQDRETKRQAVRNIDNVAGREKHEWKGGNRAKGTVDREVKSLTA